MLTVNVDKTFFSRSLIFNSPTRFLRTGLLNTTKVYR